MINASPLVPTTVYKNLWFVEQSFIEAVGVGVLTISSLRQAHKCGGSVTATLSQVDEISPSQRRSCSQRKAVVMYQTSTGSSTLCHYQGHQPTLFGVGEIGHMEVKILSILSEMGLEEKKLSHLSRHQATLKYVTYHSALNTLLGLYNGFTIP